MKRRLRHKSFLQIEMAVVYITLHNENEGMPFMIGYFYLRSTAVNHRARLWASSVLNILSMTELCLTGISFARKTNH